MRSYYKDKCIYLSHVAIQRNKSNSDLMEVRDILGTAGYRK